MAEDTVASSDLLALTAEIVVSHVANNRLAASDVPVLIQTVYSALAGLGTAESTPAAPEHVPAVSVRKSLASPTHLISLIDGRPYTMLKRHLSQHGLTPAQYRVRYGLKADYPMVAPAYVEARRAIAKTIGLGRKAGETIVKAGKAVEEQVEKIVAPASKRGRKPKAASAAPNNTGRTVRARTSRRQ